MVAKAWALRAAFGAMLDIGRRGRNVRAHFKWIRQEKWLHMLAGHAYQHPPLCHSGVKEGRRATFPDTQFLSCIHRRLVAPVINFIDVDP